MAIVRALSPVLPLGNTPALRLRHLIRAPSHYLATGASKVALGELLRRTELSSSRPSFRLTQFHPLLAAGKLLTSLYTSNTNCRPRLLCTNRLRKYLVNSVRTKWSRYIISGTRNVESLHAEQSSLDHLHHLLEHLVRHNPLSPNQGRSCLPILRQSASVIRHLRMMFAIQRTCTIRIFLRNLPQIRACLRTPVLRSQVTTRQYTWPMDHRVDVQIATFIYHHLLRLFWRQLTTLLLKNPRSMG